MLAPAADLAVKIIAGFAITGQASLSELDGVQGGDDAIHLVVNRTALRRGHAGQGLIPENAALHEFHYIESPANDGFVFAQAMHVGHRHIGAVQAAHDGELALDRMCRRQQFGHRARLGAHHVAAQRCVELVGWVGLAALEGLHRQGPGKARQVFCQPDGQGGDVKCLFFGDRLGAYEMIKVAHGVVFLLWF